MAATALVKSSPGQRWQDAVKIPFGQTVFASGDDESYIRCRERPGARQPRAPHPPTGTGSSSRRPPKLVFFQVDLMERDQIPVERRGLSIVNGKPRSITRARIP